MAQRSQEIYDLFTGMKRYSIPLYQRRYVWTTTNWDALWRDLIQLQAKKHFTGTIITKSQGNDHNDMIVIDGQQRLITIQIIFRLCQDLWESGIYTDNVSDEKVKRITYDLNSYTKFYTRDADGNGNYRILINKENDKNAFDLVISGKLWLDQIQSDEEIVSGDTLIDAFNKLYDNGFNEKGEQSTQHLILTAYGYFGKQITTRLIEEGFDELERIVSVLENDFHVISANLEQEDDPQQAYGSSNDTGVALDEFDLLRNDLFLRVKDRDTQNELYRNIWRIFDDNPFWQERLGRTDDFLRDFLMAKLGPSDFGKQRLFHDIYKGHYHRQLQENLGCVNDSDDTFVETEFKELANYAKIFEKMENQSEIVGKRRQFFRDIELIFGVDNLKPLPAFLLYLENELELDDNGKDKVYMVLESYLLRCQLRGGVNEDKTAKDKIETLFDETINGNIDVKDENIVRIFAEYLASDRPGRIWRRNGAIKSGLRSAAYQIKYDSATIEYVWNMLRYIFYRIEDKMRNDRDIDQNLGTFEDFNRSFHWPLLIKSLSKGQKPTISYNIGNITFSQESISVQPLNEKLTYLLNESNMEQVNRQIEKIANGGTVWSKTHIDERENLLLNIFDKIWPPPETFIVNNHNIADPNKHRWVSMIQSHDLQPIHFVTYNDEIDLSSIRFNDTQDPYSKVIGTTNDSDYEINKKNILLACPSAVWPEVGPHIETLYYVGEKKLKRIDKLSESLRISDDLLSSIKEKQLTVIPVTRFGHVLEGVIEDFDNESIYLQSRDQTIIVFRSGIYEFAINEWQEGVVTEFNEDKQFGYIESNEYRRIYVMIDEVKDQNIRSLEPGQKVEFDLNLTKQEGGISAINVELVE